METTKKYRRNYWNIISDTDDCIYYRPILIYTILKSPNYLVKASENKSNLLIGVLFDLLNAVAYLGIAVLVYPTFKIFSERLALLCRVKVKSVYHGML